MSLKVLGLNGNRSLGQIVFVPGAVPLGGACHGANALCRLCVWHSYITDTVSLRLAARVTAQRQKSVLKITSGPSPFSAPRGGIWDRSGKEREEEA